jgi:hypothetical protein
MIFKSRIKTLDLYCAQIYHFFNKTQLSSVVVMSFINLFVYSDTPTHICIRGCWRRKRNWSLKSADR